MGHSLSECRVRVALIDRLTHHAEIISIDIDGESCRKREAEQAQKRKQAQKPKR
jgi:DNA replication protein DnaC